MFGGGGGGWLLRWQSVINCFYKPGMIYDYLNLCHFTSRRVFFVVGVFTARCEVKWKSGRSRLEKNVEKLNFFGGGFEGGFFDVIDMFARREDFGTKILSTF